MIRIRLCVISKYPPIEGGVSSKTYWICKGLGKLGNKVYVVTNAWEVEKEFREDIPKRELSELEPKNVRLFSTSSSPPFHIPYSQCYLSKLTSLALNVVKEYDPNVLFSFYFMPYGLCGYLVKMITRKPFVLRHAGSDITRLFEYPFFRNLFIEMFSNADKILTSQNKKQLFLNLKIPESKLSPLYDGVDTEAFNPRTKPFDLSKYTGKNLDGIPIFTYIGKISKLKQTYNFLKAVAKIKDEKFVILLIVGSGKYVEDLKGFVKSLHLEKKVIFMPFQPPWKIPSLMTKSTAIVSPESEETPYLPTGTHYPIIIREAMACGCCTIIGEGIHKKGLYTQLEDGVNTITINPENTSEFAKKLKSIANDSDKAYKIGKEARKVSESIENYKDSLKKLENLFQEVINVYGG
jgi:glycosyltransferase involved in cell wall biosynthesis